MRWKSVVLAALIVGACSGGGSNPPPPPANSAPVITSAATASAAENTTAAVYQATATDADGNSISFRIEGPDAGRFTINGSGAISFSSAPNFEAPADADANNAYQITLVASDGKAESRANLTITVTNVADQFTTRRVGPSDSFVAAVPGSSRIFTGARAGDTGYEIHLIDPAPGGAQTLYMTVGNVTNESPGQRNKSNLEGVINLVAAPDYATSGNIYAYVQNAGTIEIRRYGRLASGLGDPNGDLILRITEDLRGNSSPGGGLAFGPDGLLYIATGFQRRTGTNNDPQNPDTLTGKLLRIDLRRDEFPADPDRDYGIPSGNPASTGRREIIAFGLDDPYRMSFDGPNLLIGDSQPQFQYPEEIDLFRPQDVGANYGAPFTGNSPGQTPPVISLPGDPSLTNQRRITGGHVYRGPITQLTGQYIFAYEFSLANNSVFAVPASSLVQGQTVSSPQLTLLSSSLPQELRGFIRSLGVDTIGNLYFVTNRSAYILEYS